MNSGMSCGPGAMTEKTTNYAITAMSSSVKKNKPVSRQSKPNSRCRAAHKQSDTLGGACFVCVDVCTHQTENKQVGSQQDSAVTCASCETCSLCRVVESVNEHMKKPLFDCTDLIAPIQRKKCQFVMYHHRLNAPWRRTMAIASVQPQEQTVKPFSSSSRNLNTALPHVQRSRVPRSTHGRALRIPSSLGVQKNGAHREKRHLIGS